MDVGNGRGDQRRKTQLFGGRCRCALTWYQEKDRQDHNRRQEDKDLHRPAYPALTLKNLGHVDRQRDKKQAGQAGRSARGRREDRRPANCRVRVHFAAEC